MGVEASGEQMLYKMDEVFEQIGCKCRQNTDNKTQNQDKLVLRYMLLTPTYKTIEQTNLFILIHHSLITVTTPFDVSLIILDDFARPFSSCL